MKTTRRDFIKRSAGVVAVGLVTPRMWLGEAQARGATTAQGRKILVVVQLFGGNDGLNTVVPYTDPQYFAMRPHLGFKDTDLKDSAGNSTIISDRFGFHPAMSGIKTLYDAGKVAVVLGVGFANPNLSHFLSMDIWHTANSGGMGSEGWLGRYADVALIGQPGLPAASVGGVLPKTFYSADVVIPSILSFDTYDFITDPLYPGDSKNQLALFERNASRQLPPGSANAAISMVGLSAVKGALQLKSAISGYNSTIVYPQDNPLAVGMKMVAEIITTVPEANLLYVSMGSFDTHSDQILHPNNQPNKAGGTHAQLLGWFSDAVKLFYDDMSAHSLADNVLMMQWSEFGRRVNENSSLGTDHGTAAPVFVIGNGVNAGLHGQQPSLAASDLDNAGNMQYAVDFRSIYSTILDQWLGVDSTQVLGASFDHAGFL
jgi:uncharacterized protein (DUF1501 family)